MLGLEAYAAELALALVAAMLAAFASERFAPEVVAISGMAACLLLGLVDTQKMLGALSNSAPWTIIAMFILTTALVRTGLLESLGFRLQQLKRFGFVPLMSVFIVVNTVISSLFNNIPQVVMMIPVTIALAQACDIAPSRMLMPLSFATILGGTLSLIGASTNLLVDGVVQSAGLAPISMFEITPVGALVALAGSIYLVIAARYLIPVRTTVTDALGLKSRAKFLVEVLIPQNSPHVGANPLDVPLFKGQDRTVVDVVRGDASLRRNFSDIRLEVGDIVVLRSAVENVLTLREGKGVEVRPSGADPESEDIEPVATRRDTLVEAIVGPTSRWLGRTLRQERLRRRYGVYPVALHRHEANLNDRLEDIPLQVGDTLLLEGAPADLANIAADCGLINLSQPQERGLRHDKAPIAALSLGLVVALSAFDVMPIVGLAWIGVAVVLLSRCVDADEAMQAVEWRIIILLYAMLVIGRALESSGAVQLVVDSLLPLISSWPRIAILAVVYVLASLLTEIVTANAVVIVMTPIAMTLAVRLGLDPRGFAIAVMFAASASFATPIGYQTNTLVYAAGGYRFTDFVRIGAPLNLIVGVVAVLGIAWWW